MRVEDEFSLGFGEIKVFMENFNGKYRKELDIYVEFRENFGLEIGIFKFLVRMIF